MNSDNIYNDFLQAVLKKRKNSVLHYSQIRTFIGKYNNLMSMGLSSNELDALMKRLEYDVPMAGAEPTNSIGEGLVLAGNSASNDVLYPSFGDSFWARYSYYLINDCNFSEEAVADIKLSCEAILAHCADPNAKSKHTRKGLVLGDVQSGKTANYLGLMSLALDVGYRIIIVLTGMTDSLRVQTQQRIDEAVIGQTNDKIPIGVGLRSKVTHELPYVIPLTNSVDDFKTYVKNISQNPNDFTKPVILAVKKNGPILTSVCKFFKNCRNKSILIIDDEADNASINTKSTRKDPNLATTINAKIRKLLSYGDNVSYVGYTATPFANIFINPELTKGKVPDLFPRDFICPLTANPAYMGPGDFFGKDFGRYCYILDDHPTENDPTYKMLQDAKATDNLTSLPDSLKHAVLHFMLANVVRTLRGTPKAHRSMLVNVNVKINVHTKLRDMIEQFKEDTLETLYELQRKSIDDFVKVGLGCQLYEIYKRLPACEEVRNDPNFTFEQLRDGLVAEVEQISVCAFNSQNLNGKKTRFSYDSKPNGARLIAIGGSVLARGLTLNGLIISYYLRRASAFDTLLQMGRWFGYRTGYKDLCCVYITLEAIEDFQDAMNAIEDVRSQLMQMIALGKTPKDFGLSVIENPDVLRTKIFYKSRKLTSTARCKSSFTEEVDLNYAGPTDMSKIYTDERNIQNIKRFEEFVLEQAKSERLVDPNTGVLKNVPKADLVNLILDLKTPFVRRFIPRLLADYIEKSSDLEFWDVGIVKGLSATRFSVGAYQKPANIRQVTDHGEYVTINNNRVSIIENFALGLTPEQIREVDNVVRNSNGKKSRLSYLNASGRNPILLVYPIAHPETKKLLLGFSVGIPGDKKSQRCRINDVYLKNIIEGEDEDEE